MLPVGADSAERLDRPVDAADERRGVAVSSIPTRPAELMAKTPATATARLLHHAHLCQPSDNSVRLSHAITGLGGSP